MFYGHIYTIVTVHSIKDCQLSRSTVTSFLLNILGHYTIIHHTISIRIVAYMLITPFDQICLLHYNHYNALRQVYIIILIYLGGHSFSHFLLK